MLCTPDSRSVFYPELNIDSRIPGLLGTTELQVGTTVVTSKSLIIVIVFRDV